MPSQFGHIGFIFKCCNRDYSDNCNRQIATTDNYSLIELVPADETHKEFSYQVKKEAEGEYITRMFGWDEDVQRHFHAWQEKKPDIITYGGKLIGTVAAIGSEDCIEVGQFFVLPDYQNKGIGTHLLKNILNKADQPSENFTL